MNYFVFQNGQQRGPLTWPELQAMLAQGTLAGTDQVRLEVGGEWVTLAALAASLGVEAPSAGTPGVPAFATIPAYAQPGSDLNAGPSYRLFDFRAVMVATIVGSPLAGVILMALNYRRLGQGAKAAAALGYGLLVTVLGFVVSFFLPQGMGSGVGIGLAFATMNVAKTSQGPAVEEHVRQGGKLASRWIAFFVGLGVLVVILGIVAVAVVAGLLLKPSS